LRRRCQHEPTYAAQDTCYATPILRIRQIRAAYATPSAFIAFSAIDAIFAAQHMPPLLRHCAALLTPK